MESKESVDLVSSFSLDVFLPSTPDTKKHVKQESPASAPPTPEALPPLAAPDSQSSETPMVFASPIAKKLAKERGLDLSKMKGSGPGGRVIEQDVVQSATVAAPNDLPPAGRASSLSNTTKAPKSPTADASTDYVDIPLSNVRKVVPFKFCDVQVIASRLTDSKSLIPHYYLTAEIAMDKCFG